MSVAADSPNLPRQPELVMERLVAACFVAALACLAISMLGGLLVALQRVHWNPLDGIELLAPGRWRMIHTNASAYPRGRVCRPKNGPVPEA